MKHMILALALIIPATDAVAQTLPPLHEDRRVRASFYAAGMADIIRNNCSELSGRDLRGLRYALALRSYAFDKGYTRDDVDTLLKNEQQAEILRQQIVRDLGRRGATPGNEEGYCTVGREEIARNTLAGRLLRDDG